MRWRFWIVVVVTFVSSVASAETAEDKRIAKQYYELGASLYGRSEYKAALKQFEQAYNYAKAPDLVYNMARCNELLGRHAKAIALYQEYLKLKGGEGAKVVQPRITTLQRKLAKENAKVAADSAKTRAQEAKLASERQARLRLEAELARTEGAKQARKGQAARSGPAWPGWTLVGAGSAFLAAGIVSGVMASNRASFLEDENRLGTLWTDVAEDQDSGETFQAVQIAATITGAVALSAGATWILWRYFKSKNTERQTRASLLPALLPGGGYVAAKLIF